MAERAWHWLPIAAGVTMSVMACGGGSKSDAGGSASTSTAASTFPTGLAIDSPTAVGEGTAPTAAARFNGLRYATDWIRAARQAWQQGDTQALARLSTAALPMGSAHARNGRAPALHEKAALIEKVLSGDSSVPLAAVLDLDDLFSTGGGNANCYGPTLLYASHQDSSGGPDSGTLPGGDLGLWTATEGNTAVPCVAAQFNARVSGVRRQTVQGLLMMAAMRKAIAVSPTVSMPAPGNTVNVRLPMAAALGVAFAGRPFVLRTDLATVSLDSAGSTYTYRLVLDNDRAGDDYRRGEIIMRHTPGDGDTAYSGVLQVSGFQHSNDAALGCTDTKSSDHTWFQTARVSTVKYSREGGDVQFSARAANYCGHPSDDAGLDYGAQVASFQADGQLDPTVKLSAQVRGSTLGWRGNFERFAGDYDRDDVTGTFLYAWQAGTGDSHARALVAASTLDTVSGDRTVQGHFAFSGAIDGSHAGEVQGMICNWAGPGNSHTPTAKFQSQTAVLTASASSYAVSGSSKITYAPTNSCNSTTTTYDVDVNGSLTSSEGVGTVADLDGLSGSHSTVDEELRSRGWSLPGLY